MFILSNPPVSSLSEVDKRFQLISLFINRIKSSFLFQLSRHLLNHLSAFIRMRRRKFLSFFRIIFQIVKQSFGLLRSFRRIVINQFPIAQTVGSEVAATMGMREMHQERFGTFPVRLTAQLPFQVEPVYHIVLGNFAACHRQNCRINIHASVCLRPQLANVFALHSSFPVLPSPL